MESLYTFIYFKFSLKGYIGPRGPDGSMGEKGLHGPKGEQGYDGSKGNKGFTFFREIKRHIHIDKILIYFLIVLIFFLIHYLMIQLLVFF